MIIHCTQDILLENQSAFESERLVAVKDQFLLQTKATFDGILRNPSEETAPQLDTLRYLTILTHRLSAMQTRGGNNDQALETIDQACGWMQRSLNFANLSEEIRKNCSSALVNSEVSKAIFRFWQDAVCRQNQSSRKLSIDSIH